MFVYMHAHVYVYICIISQQLLVGFSKDQGDINVKQCTIKYIHISLHYFPCTRLTDYHTLSILNITTLLSQIWHESGSRQRWAGPSVQGPTRQKSICWSGLRPHLSLRLLFHADWGCWLNSLSCSCQTEVLFIVFCFCGLLAWVCSWLLEVIYRTKSQDSKRQLEGESHLLEISPSKLLNWIVL